MQFSVGEFVADDRAEGVDLLLPQPRVPRVRSFGAERLRRRLSVA
jgi:hypothetical protein